MAELRDAGAVGFTDDGKPVPSAGMLRRALQYQRLCGGVIALHEEDPALSGAGVMHEGAVSALLGMAGIPAVSESTMIARDAALAGLRGRAYPRPAPLGRGVGAGGRRRQGRAACGSAAEATPHHLTLTDEAVRSARHAPQDEPAAARRGRPPGADRRPARRHDRLRRHRPRAPRARGEGGPVRAGADGDDRASRPPSRRSTPTSSCPASAARAAGRADDAGAALFGLPRAVDRRRRARQRLPGRPARRSGRSARPATRAARRTAASPAARCAGRVLLTVAGRRGRLPRALARRRGGMSRMLDRERTALVVVDVQEAFRKAVPDFDAVARGSAVLVQGARALGVPVVVTEQYPKGLGETVPEVAEHLEGERRRSRRSASRPRAPRASTSAAATRRSSAGSRPTSASTRPSTTCSSPRRRGPRRRRRRRLRGPEDNRDIGLRKMEQAGAVVTSVETALFELLGAAGTDEFKDGAGAGQVTSGRDLTAPTSCSRTAPASTASCCGAGGPPPARSSSTPRCRATRRRSPTPPTPARSSPSPPRRSATTASAPRRWSPTASTRAR